MKPTLLHLSLFAMMILNATTIFAQNNAPIAMNDFSSTCGNTIHIDVLTNDSDPDGDSLYVSIYSGFANGNYAVIGGEISYTPFLTFTGYDTLVYIIRDKRHPVKRDTASLVVDVFESYSYNVIADICEGDSMLIAGQWQTTSGMYIDSLHSIYNCDSIITTTLNVNHPIPANIIANGPTHLCGDDSVRLTATNGVSWLWSNGQSTQSILVTTAGAYSVSVSDGICSQTSAPVAVTGGIIPDTTIGVAGSLSFCEGDSVVLTAPDGSYWLWSNGVTTQTIIVDTNAILSVTITNADGCSATTASIPVTVFPAAEAVVTPSGPTTFCSGDSVHLTASSGSAWLWSNGATTQTITVTESGFYVVTINYGICSSTSAPLHVTVYPAPDAIITQSGTATFCEGGSVTLTASDALSWQWSTGDTTQSIIAASSGQYFVHADFGVCARTSSRVTVTVNPNPEALITASGPLHFCQGDSVVLLATDGTFWMWPTGENTQAITVTESGMYSVIVYNEFGCSLQSPEVIVVVDSVPGAFITPTGATTFCTGDLVILYASEGQSYLWSTGDTTQGITVSTSGYYSVEVSHGACSSASLPTTVIALPVPEAKITTSGSTTLCEGESVTLYVLGGSIYYWSNGSPYQNITVSETGTFWVVLSNGACADTSEPVTVTVNPLPAAIVTVSGFTTFCEGDSIKLLASDGQSWEWSNGESSQMIYCYSSGPHHVTVTDSNGCSETSSPVYTTVYPQPSANFTFTPEGLNTTFTNQSANATAYYWNFGDNTTSAEQHPFHIYDSPGMYTVKLISSNSCGNDTIIKVLTIDGSSVASVYTGFSPNGDGHNDVWTIPMLESNSNNTVTIINRWGSEVWKADGYNNQNIVWSGKNMNDEELPDGTYYYIISANGEEQRGWVFVKR